MTALLHLQQTKGVLSLPTCGRRIQRSGMTTKTLRRPGMGTTADPNRRADDCLNLKTATVKYTPCL